MGEQWHGEIRRSAYRKGEALPEGSDETPDLRLYWVPRPSKQQIEQIGRELEINPRALARANDHHIRARADRYGDTTFLIVRPARYIDKLEQVEFGELQMIIGPDYAVLLGRCGIFPLESFIERLQARPEMLARGPAAVKHAALWSVVEGYEPVIVGLENDIDEIEDQVFRSDEDPLRRIYELIREVIGFQRASEPLTSMLTSFLARREMGHEEMAFVRDAHERALNASERAASFRSLLENVLNVNLALESKRLSEVSIAQTEQTKKISSWAAILFTPTLVGGIYGMNFEHMPELQWEYGYPFALGLMLAMAFGLYAVFKRRDWL
ncbi:MAG: magnesium and cobalt transport protein CorA [Solirubrobacteraceae bacterium]|nr:magnesium and cobalt transport protein CorA [Solirubrobacteraceae bacterium]